MKNIFLKTKSHLLISIIVCFIMASCQKDQMNEVGTVYTGPDQVEFAHLTGSLSRSITTATTPRYDSVKIQLVAPQRSTPTSVTFTVDASSTAVAGTDYVILQPSSGTTATIDANSSIAWVKVQFNKVIAAKTLKLNLTGGDMVTVSENYKSIVFSLK